MNKMASIEHDGTSSYDTDAYGWAMAQAALIRAGQFDIVDWENVAEEIESVGRSEKNTLKSNLTQVLIHMLKWEIQPERRGMSWWLSIMNHRIQAEDVIFENPSLKPIIDDVVRDALIIARKKAIIEMNMKPKSLDHIHFTTDDTFNRPYERPESE
jgi:hypothetical protein